MKEINKKTRKDLFMIDPRTIRVEEGFNSRINFDIEPLKESIRENGVLSPLTVIKETNSDGTESYRLVDGERRYRAVCSLLDEGMDIARIPAIFISKMSDADLLTQQIVRNDGKPFNEYEYGIACRKFVAYGFTQEEIAKKIGKDSGQVSYYLKHFTRDEEVQELLKEGRISGSEVRRIYAEHSDEKGAVEEIKKAKEKNEKKGKTKITLSDLEEDGKTLSSRASKTILKGLDTLFEYYDKFSRTVDGRDIDINLDIMDVRNELKKGKNIIDIFTEARDEALGIVKEAV